MGDTMRALYRAVVLLHVALIWWLPIFPTQDGPTHVYSTLILSDLLDGGALYGKFFDVQLAFVPNLGATVPLYALLSVLPPVVAEKAFVTIVFVLIAVVTPRLARLAGGEPYPASFLILPLFGSGLMMYGFYSLMVGEALWLWAIWLFWRTAGKSLWIRWVVTTGCALVLFAAHFMAFGCFVLAIVCAWLGSGVRAGAWRARLGPLAALLLVPAILTAWYAYVLVSTGGGVGTIAGPVRWTSGLDLQRDVRALFDLAMWNQITLSRVQVCTGSLLLGLTAWSLYRPAIRPMWSASGSGPEGVPADTLTARRSLGMLAATLIVLMLVVPDEIGELSLIKYRFPTLVALLVPAILACARYQASHQVIVVGIALLAATVNVVLVHGNAQRLGAFVYDGPSPSVRGQFVTGYRPHPPDIPADTLRHAASYYCALRDCVDVGNYQPHTRQFFVRFKMDPVLAARPILAGTAAAVDWDRFPTGITYLLGVEVGAADQARMRNHFALVRQAGPVTIWRRRSGGHTLATAAR
jgi:hypothetical protein